MMTRNAAEHPGGDARPVDTAGVRPSGAPRHRSDAAASPDPPGIVLTRRIGEGACADVWEGEDTALGRRVAVKIVRASMVGVADARAHARALAKVHDPNVVAVYGLARVRDPETGRTLDAVVMEFVDGVTLADVFAGRASLAAPPAGDGAAPPDPLALAAAVLDGVGAIHAAGTAHGDLHAGNIMVARGGVKILDLFSRGTTASLGTAPREARRRHDAADAREVVRDLLRLAWPAERVDAFSRAAAASATVAEVRAVLADAVASAADARPDVPATPAAPGAAGVGGAAALDAAFGRLTEAGFPDDAAYARALLDDTPGALRGALLVRLVTADAYRPHHGAYVRAAHTSLDAASRAEVLAALAPVIDGVVPDGAWGRPLHMLGALGPLGFPHLPPTTRLRLEHHLLRDLRQGRQERANVIRLGPPRGQLARHVNAFWPYLDRAHLAQALVESLRGDWYSQNYVAAHFFPLLPRLADTPERRAALLGGLRTALMNRAHMVRAYLTRLPAEWRAELAPEAATAGESAGPGQIEME
jgi:hypothetical protein